MRTGSRLLTLYPSLVNVVWWLMLLSGDCYSGSVTEVWLPFCLKRVTLVRVCICMHVWQSLVHYVCFEAQLTTFLRKGSIRGERNVTYTASATPVLESVDVPQLFSCVTHVWFFTDMDTNTDKDTSVIEQEGRLAQSVDAVEVWWCVVWVSVDGRF